MASAEQYNPLCRNMISCCGIHLLLCIFICGSKTAVIPNSIPQPCCEKLNANWKPRMFEIRGGRGLAVCRYSQNEEDCLLAYDIVKFGSSLQTFRRHLLTPSSGQNVLMSHPRRQYRRSSTYAVVALRKVKRKSNFAQVGTEQTYG